MAAPKRHPQHAQRQMAQNMKRGRKGVAIGEPNPSKPRPPTGPIQPGKPGKNPGRGGGVLLPGPPRSGGGTMKPGKPRKPGGGMTGPGKLPRRRSA